MMTQAVIEDEWIWQWIWLAVYRVSDKKWAPEGAQKGERHQGFVA